MGNRKKSKPRFILTPEGKARLKRTVAYVGEKYTHSMTGKQTYNPPQFMLSVYAYAYKYVNGDADKAWNLVARMVAPRSTTKDEQRAYLEVLTYKAALEHNFDFVIEIEANHKMPTKVTIIDRRE